MTQLLSAHGLSCADVAASALAAASQGSVMLIGPSGVTRALILQAVAHQVRQCGGRVVTVSSHALPRLGLRAFMARLADLPEAEFRDTSQIRLAFDRLTRIDDGCSMTVLIIDGAEALSQAVFHYIQLALRSSASLRVLLASEEPMASLLEPALGSLHGQLTIVLQPERMEQEARDLTFARHFSLPVSAASAIPRDPREAVLVPPPAPVAKAAATRRLPVAWAAVCGVALAVVVASQWPVHDRLAAVAPSTDRDAPAAAPVQAIEPDVAQAGTTTADPVASPASASPASASPASASPTLASLAPDTPEPTNAGSEVVAGAPVIAPADPPPPVEATAQPEPPAAAETALTAGVALPETKLPSLAPAAPPPALTPSESATRVEPGLVPATEAVAARAPARLATIVHRPLAVPAVPPVHAARRQADPDRCRAIVLKVQLGEDPSRDDTQFLRDGCR